MQKALKADKATPLGELAYSRLHSAIQAGTFEPGKRMMETEVAEWLKMSRTPARDAMRRLENEGLLVHEPRLGLVIATLDHGAVMELYAMREVLEGTAARLAARHASDLEVEQLLELVAVEKKLKGKYDELAAHNQRFHQALRQAAHNRFLLRALIAVRDSMGLLGKSQMTLPHRAVSALKEHEHIVRAIEKRDADGAEEVARSHVRSAQRERIKSFMPA
ncbi:MAG: GntR family transcriptional regulator [Burkholderiales bacterium]